MYDPQLGRFLQADPLRKSGPGIGGWNRFTYVNNNPTTLIDPSGLSAAENQVLEDRQAVANMWDAGGAACQAQRTGQATASETRRCQQFLTFLLGLGVALDAGGGGSARWGIIRAARDEAYTSSRHTLGGTYVQRDLRWGREAHVFDEGVNLSALERSVWTQGTYHGVVRGFERWTYRSEVPIGRRIQQGKPDVPLHVVEIKGRVTSNGTMGYHLVPKTRPA
jgi:hypothetical protein